MQCVAMQLKDREHNRCFVTCHELQSFWSCRGPLWCALGSEDVEFQTRCHYSSQESSSDTLYNLSPHLNTMTLPVPSGLPPPDLHARALTALLARLDVAHPDIPTLRATLALTARRSLQDGMVHDVRPLQALNNIASDGQGEMPLDMVLNGIISYPTHLVAISSFVDLAITQHPALTETIRTEIIPDLVTRLRLSTASSDLGAASRILLTLSRAHDELLAVILAEADYVLPALKDAYQKLGGDKSGIRAKSDMLVFCDTLVRAMGAGGSARKEALKRLMSDSAGPSKQVLVNGTLRSDYEAVFERKAGLEEGQIDTLLQVQDDEARDDPVSVMW